MLLIVISSLSSPSGDPMSTSGDSRSAFVVPVLAKRGGASMARAEVGARSS